MSFFHDVSLKPGRGRRPAQLKPNPDDRNLVSPKITDEKNLVALSTIKEIINTLENVKTKVTPEKKKLVPPYYHATMYSPPYYDQVNNKNNSDTCNENDECRQGRRGKKKSMLKFNGLQDVILDFETKLKPESSHRHPFSDSPASDNPTNKSTDIEKTKDDFCNKPRPKRKGKSPLKIHPAPNFETVQTQTEIDRGVKPSPEPINPTCLPLINTINERINPMDFIPPQVNLSPEVKSHLEYKTSIIPTSLPTINEVTTIINPMDFIPPGTKLCPTCSEALRRGQIPPGGFQRLFQNQFGYQSFEEGEMCES